MGVPGGDAWWAGRWWGRARLEPSLTNLGLPELIARTPEQYVRACAGLGGDLGGLARKLRAALRGRMQPRR